MNDVTELYTELLPNLFMGGTDDNDIIKFPKRLPGLSEREDFDAVVTCYSYAQPMSWYVHENRFGFADGPMDSPTFAKVEELAHWLYEKWISGQRCLSRCQAGWNRSGLIVALMLVRHGFKAEDAINLIRSKRSPNALNNTDFLEWVKEYEANRCPIIPK